MYKTRSQLMNTSKYHKRKGYNDTYEAYSTLLFEDYLIMIEQAELNGITVSNQIANVIHDYVKNNRLAIEKDCNKNNLKYETNKNEREYLYLIIPKESINCDLEYGRKPSGIHRASL